MRRSRITALLGAAGICGALMLPGGAGMAAAAATPGHTGNGAHPVRVARLAVAGGTLPAAVVGKPYTYQFRLAGGGAASWAPLAGLPLGLALDPSTGVLSGVPEEAGTQQLVVSASRGGAHPALGSGSAVLAVRTAANGGATIWAANARRPALASPLTRRAASGSVTVPAAGVASALYQAAYFQAVDNPRRPQPDLVNVLLADVAARVYATNPAASTGDVESGLAALKKAFSSARNPQVPAASAGRGLQSFGPTLVPQLTGALGVMISFARSSGAGVIAPGVKAAAKAVYSAYLKTSIATGIGFSTGYAGFSDRSLYDVGDMTASGFHALVSGPAIERAVACGQADTACAAVEDSLLSPVVKAGIGAGAVVSVTQTPAQLQAADPVLAKMLSSQGVNVTLNGDGSLTVPAGGFNRMLTRVGNLNVSLTTKGAGKIKALFDAQGDPASPHDVSAQADSDLGSLLPPFNLTLTGTLFDNGLASRVSLKGSSDDKPLVDGSSVAQGLIALFKTFDADDVTDITVTADFVGVWVDVFTHQWGDAVKNLFGLLGALTGPAPDEALILAQQTQQMIQKVFDALTQDLNAVEQSIQNVQTTLTDMFKEMELGFSDIDFENHLILSGLTTVDFTLGQLEYQTDLTDGDVVAFGQGEIQTQIQGTINQCLDRAARQLAPLDFAEFSDCASQFKTEALTSASNDVVEFSTPPPPAPGNGDLGPDGTVATTLQAHGPDQAANLRYLLGILNHWYGLGTDPAGLSTPVVNPGVWSEVALGYRELLDEYPQFSAGTEPDLPAIEGPGQQNAQLIGALQQVDGNNTNAAVQQVGANYLAAFNQLTGDIAAHNANFPNAPLVAYGTPDAHSWAGYDPFGGIEQPVPAGNDPSQQITSIPSCDGTGDTAVLDSAQNWESGVDLPKSWYILYNLVAYANPNLAPMPNPICYTNFQDSIPDPSEPKCMRVDEDFFCDWHETVSASLQVRFMGTDGQPHVFHQFDIPPQLIHCSSDNQIPACPWGTVTQDFEYWMGSIARPGDDPSSALLKLLSSLGAQNQPATRDVLDSEASQIISTEQSQAFKWELGPFSDPNVPDHALYVSDSVDLTGALDLLQLLAQTLAPAVSVGDQVLADILYGQDQLPSTLNGPNNPLAVFQAQRAGTGTQTLAQYASVQQGRLAEAENLLNGFLASARQAAGPAPAAAPRPGLSTPADDLATANAPVLTYSVLDQLATGALLDTDIVSVTSPGTLTSAVGTAVSQQLSATSLARAPITGWSATGLPPGLVINAKTGKITGSPTQAGTFTVTATATDTIGTSRHNFGQATFTWTVVPPCGSQLITDGGFETGISPWTATPGTRIAAATATPAFAGNWLARLGGRTAPRTDTLSQAVMISPACTAASLSFELRVLTGDPATAATDTLKVQVVSPAGKVLKTLATFSNQNASASYAPHFFSLKPWLGQQVTITFTGSETLTGHTTSFLLDNVGIAGI